MSQQAQIASLVWPSEVYVMKRDVDSSRPRFSRTMAIALSVLAIIGGVGVGAWVWLDSRPADDDVAAAVSPLRLEEIPFDGASAYKYLKDLCAIGPRPSGSEGMKLQQKMLIEHFQKLGAQVGLQQFRVRHPQDDSWVPMTNIIVRWNPEAAERILLCAHYDTLPYPMYDPTYHEPIRPGGRFVGANDNASGVAILMQMGHDMKELKTKYGVDFVFLDGEEFIFSRHDRFFLGSEYFARKYANDNTPGKPRYRWGVLLDMVGDADLRILQDRSSAGWRDTRPLVQDIWTTAARLGVREFVPRLMRQVDFTDDHIMLHDVGGIPCIDVIDFDYPPWHTEADTPERCSPLSLAKVGWVIREWLKSQ